MTQTKNNIHYNEPINTINSVIEPSILEQVEDEDNAFESGLSG